MKRGVLWLWAFGLGAFLFCLPVPTRAAAEFCPATVAGAFTQVDPSSYRFRLAAISERSVSGFIRVQTKDGWYNAPFTNVALQSAAKMYDDEGMTFSHDDFVSPDIVVHFPTPQQVLYGYVSQAQTKGEKLLDWDKEGMVTCLPTPPASKTKAPAKPPVLPPLGSDAVALQAKAIDAPFSEQCPNPSQPVSLAVAPQLQMPAPFGRDDPSARPTGTTAVVVAVERDGSVVDAWLWETSGTPLLDNAVLEQARKSTFKPGRMFCRDVPGYLLMRTEFKS